MRRTARVAAWILGALAVVVLAAAAAVWFALRASLPDIEGETTLAGLSAPAEIERDAAGVPVIRGASRADVARATGYAHAQDRLFQMDLLRRTGAGELAALLGPGLVETDRHIRTHQFRLRAREALAALGEGERALLEAYAEGVNAGTAALAARPFEYLLLGQSPAPWCAEDSILVVHAMWIDLQGLDDADEQQRGRLAAALPDAVYRLLVEPDPAWEAPLDGSRLPEVPMPAAEQYDLRTLDRSLFESLDAPGAGDAAKVGSNNWAVAGSRARGGGAVLANDMHLGLRVPNVWYRARLVAAAEGLDVTGASLPGVPAIVAGSNGRVAWGFTNSYGDFQDLVRLEAGPEADTYLTADGPRAFELDRETIEVAGADPVTLELRRTIWGPVIGDDGDGHDLALAWTAHRTGATDMALLGLERARDLDGAAAAIGGAGMPAQNVMIADAGGRIGWVLSGRLPLRAGIDPKRPSPWHAAGAGWQGWLPREAAPRLLDPPAGLAWSANARVVGGEDFARIGDGDYAAAARARQIRDRLTRLDAATAIDMLAIQLDERADYLAYWQPVLLAALGRAGEAEAAALVAGWSGRAAVDDAGYRLLRDFERHVAERAFRTIAAPALARWPEFDWRAPERFTEVAWRLLAVRPPHLLDPRFADWDTWLADIAVRTVRDRPAACANLADCRWGAINVARIRHPISEAMPVLGRFLDMPAEPLPGDWSMPRVQSPGFGASERFSVSPGREAEGYFHMPGGQSGHPLSPFYRAGHAAWVRGEATPFLPGEAAHMLRLLPVVR
ncbi:MAG: penicillin acylase family protein [Gammaproteobacteria bacterium]|nr:penicillin acylase family protein [Gammaproteobacteria bacterium]